MLKTKVIDAAQLSFSYGDVPVLSNITFGLNKGGFAALIGSNGTGKSTLLKLLLGELSPTSGTVRLLGTELGAFRAWTKIGYVPQEGLARQADFPASVEEIVQANLFSEIGLFRFPKREHREKVRKVLARVGMDGCEKRLIGELSGGQRQRVLLARALISMPEVMILDEPTTGMDQESADDFYRLLSELNKSAGLSILMVSHDVERVCGYVSTVYCLEQGTMAVLTPAELREETAHRHPHPAAAPGGGAIYGNL